MNNNCRLFLIMFKIGLFTFGGGYAMIPLIQESVMSNSWLTTEEILNFIAIAESTPGPIAINMATFVGMSQGGFWGALVSTIGVVLPSFIIILLISIVLKNLLNYSPVKVALNGIKPIITALILATSITLFLSVIFAIEKIQSSPSFNYMGLILLSMLAVIYFVYYKWKKKTIPPIVLICISGIAGVFMFGI